MRLHSLPRFHIQLHFNDSNQDAAENSRHQADVGVFGHQLGIRASNRRVSNHNFLIMMTTAGMIEMLPQLCHASRHA